MTADARTKGIKLLHLYRRGVGGERANAGRLLLAHLRTHDLTLYDLDNSLPVSQDLSALENWRESAALLAKLGTPEEAQALTQLVDAPDLTSAELERLLAAVDLGKLVDVRADGWAYKSGGDAEMYRRVGHTVGAAALHALSGSLAQRLEEATLRAVFFQTHPRRLIRTDNAVQQHFALGVVRALSGQPGEPTEGGIYAHLDIEQLARLRALLAQHSAEAERRAWAAAEAYGTSLR